jgi:hypothetical protein
MIKKTEANERLGIEATIFWKLSAARIMLQEQPLTKSGANKFAGYKYFELGDFLPAIQRIFNDVGLVDVVSFTADIASLTLYDSDNGQSIVFTSPMGSANLKGCHEVQNIGAVETYQRRYLYVTALAIVESDSLDATTGNKDVEPPKKAEKKPEPKDDPSFDAFTFKDKMVEWGQTAQSQDELTSLWKNNQASIDKLKSGHAELFKHLVSLFGELKLKFQEEE